MNSFCILKVEVPLVDAVYQILLVSLYLFHLWCECLVIPVLLSFSEHLAIYRSELCFQSTETFNDIDIVRIPEHRHERLECTLEYRAQYDVFIEGLFHS